MIPARRMRVAVTALLFALCANALLAPEASAQRKKNVRPNDPSTCPYTGGDPEKLAAGGIVSLGGFPFATSDTAAIDKAYPNFDIRWIETPHLRIGIALAPYTVRQDERAKIDAELDALRLIWPTIPKRPRVLDPWLRAHLFAARAEKHYARILEVLERKPSDFPPRAIESWDMTGPFMGLGPYLGMREKYELLILPSAAAGKQFLLDTFGLRVESTMRWNVRERGALTLIIPVGEPETLRDTGLHCHVVFNLTTNFIDGYRFYAYELPVWLREGLAHVMEREIDPSFNSFTMSEGAPGSRILKSDWLGEVRKLVRAGTAPRLAELVHVEAYGDLDTRHHLVSWSMTDYLLRQHPKAYAQIQYDLNGRTNAAGYTDGSGLKDAHREAFRKHLGMSYAAFDEAWTAWVLSPAAEGRGAGTGRDEPAPLVPVGGGAGL